ncbi:flavodoxin family protein [Methanobrevibacter curvatus]|uniref:2-amino-4-deoxychorismate dehydrogenase n=1 Tax=Methanobrevibacter curvatus TaxID=49547 RepID=A0A166A3J6_9EURY|nr:flavodoxin family protein [Methanobrevibacter curvatus]KZX11519.1 2-amino-4-deoxychorismate dehydrogenase [Methanobrevibacter curvatus]
MVDVVLLNASPRENSNTLQILNVCKEVIEENGLSAKILSLKSKKIESCTACGECGNLGVCSIDDGLNEIIEEIRKADGFIPASPVYFGTARGDLMSALQRIGFVSKQSDQFLSWMVGGPIAVARRGGQSLTLQEMTMFFPINEMIIPGSIYWNIVFAQAEGTALEDEEGVATIQRFGENVAKLIQKIRD